MTKQVQCPYCEREFPVPTAYTNRRVKCVNCKKTLVILVSGTDRLVAQGQCPYCDFLFQERLTHDRECLSCKNKVMVRHGKLLTKQQAVDYDAKELVRTAKAIAVANRTKLLGYKKDGVKYVRIFAAGESSCPACMALHDKRFPVDKELQKPNLPIESCNGSYGYCRCTYMADEAIVQKKSQRVAACQLCGGVMRRKTLSSGNVTGIAMALLVLTAGIMIIFGMPCCGFLIGIPLCILALFMGGKRKNVLKCESCGGIVECG